MKSCGNTRNSEVELEREVRKELKQSRQLTKNGVSSVREESTLRRVMASGKISFRKLNGLKTIRKIPGH